RDRAPDESGGALGLILLTLDVFEELLGVLLVFVVEHVRDGKGLDRGELLARLGVMPEIDIHLAKLEPAKDVLRLERQRLRHALLCVVPIALVEEATPEERFGEELLEPRQSLD